MVVQKKRTFWGRTRKVLALLLLLLLVFGFAGALFIQLPMFKRLVIGELVSVVEKSTNGTLSIGKIRGNLLEGFVMDDVTLRLKTGTKYDTVPLLHIDHVLARYSLLRWLRTNEIGVTQLELDHPVAQLVKFSGDTSWNYSLLVKPVPTAPKAPPQPFTQVVDLASFRILNGSLYVRNYNFPAAPQSVARNVLDTITWADMQVHGIDLDSRLLARGDTMQRAVIHHLRFLESPSGFFLQHLGCILYHDSSHLSIEKGNLTTGHSSLAFSLNVTRPKIEESVRLDSLRHAVVVLGLNGPVISTYELRQFLPGPLGFLSGSPGIVLETSGEFGNLHIKDLALDFKGHGKLSATGDLKNLDHADSLWMNVSLSGRNLSNGTLAGYVPGLHLPDLSRIGTINIPRLVYTGEPLNFHTRFVAQSTGAGNASGDVFLDLRHHHIVYRAGGKAENFNVAAIANNNEYQSSISAEFQVAGHGTNWKTMFSTITAKTDGPSSFGKYRITSLDADGAIDAGTLTANHLDAVVEGGPEAHIRKAVLGLTQKTLPFQFDGTVTNLPLAQVLATNNPARIDLDADLIGHATDFEDVTGTAHARIFDLEYRGHALPDDTADLRIVPSANGENSLELRSQIADLSIQHRFMLGNLTEDIPRHLNALFAAVQNRDFPVQPIAVPLPTLCPDSIDFDYRLQIKDLRPLADFLPRTFLLGEGTVSGNVRGCPDGALDLTMNGDSLAFILRNRKLLDTTLASEDTAILNATSDSLTRLAIARDTTGKLAAMLRRDTSAFALPHFEAGTPRIQAMPSRLRLTLRNLANNAAEVLPALNASLDLRSDSIVRLGSALLYYPKVGLEYHNEVLNFDVGTEYNDAFGIHLNGSAAFPQGNLDATLDSIYVDYINPNPVPPALHRYAWENEGPAHIFWHRSGKLAVDTIRIIHSLSDADAAHTVNTMQIDLAGTLEGDTVYASAFIPSFYLQDIKKIVPPLNPNAKSFGFADFEGRVRDARVTLSGTLERPEFAARMFSDSITYKGAGTDITFDSNALNLHYMDQSLHGALTLHASKFASNAPGLNTSTTTKSDLTAVIDSIPMTIALKRGPTYAEDSARAAERPISAYVDATDFPLDIATPFLPPFRQVQGTGDIHFSVSGTRQNIEYSGTARIENGAALLAATNMWYRFAGPLAFAHNALTLENDTVRNIPADDPNGVGFLNGSFNFNGFDITNFDLKLRSNELMVLSDAAKVSQLPAYGPVVVNTGGTDFHFHNTFQAPWIDGTINIMSAKITMPQTAAEVQPTSNAGIIYETLPNDSMMQAVQVREHSLLSRSGDSSGARSVRMSEIDDTLFPNRMKNIFLNDDGTLRNNPYAISDSTVTAPSAALAPSFTDKLRMDLRITTEGNTSILFPFGGAWGVLGSQLNAELAPGGALTIQRGNSLDLIANGGFDLTQNSSFTFYKPMSITEGRITFTKNFTNPNIDITAEYVGTHPRPTGGSTNAKVVLRVTGTKDQPILTAENFDEIAGTFQPIPEASPEAAKEDAIYFLALGQFRTDLNSTENANAANALLPNLGAGLLADVVNNFSTSQQFAIRAANLTFGNGALGGQITGAYKNVTIKIGGYTYNPNAPANPYGLNVTTDIPLSSISSASAARTMMMEVQYNSSPTTGASILAQQPTWLSKFVWTPFHW